LIDNARDGAVHLSYDRMANVLAPSRSADALKVARADDLVALLGKGGLMASTQTRHDDIVIQRRFGVHGSTHAVKQVYAVIYPGHTDHGTERESYDDAERAALALAEEKGLSVWYEENPQSGRRTLVKNFRDSRETTARPSD
jgi:hypothetical protein